MQTLTDLQGYPINKPKKSRIEDDAESFRWLCRHVTDAHLFGDLGPFWVNKKEGETFRKVIKAMKNRSYK